MKAAIFDMDGTLLDSSPMWYSLAPTFVKQHNIEWTEQLRRDTDALGFPEAAEYFISRYPHIGIPAPQLIDIWAQMIRRGYRENVLPKPGALEYLRALNKAGIPCAVATMTNHSLSDDALARHGIDKLVKCVLTSEDVGGRGKEHPDLFLEAAKRLGAYPEECVVFEDTLYAMQTAAKAGFGVFAVSDSYQAQNAAEIKGICGRYINDYNELLREAVYK